MDFHEDETAVSYLFLQLHNTNLNVFIILF